QMDVNFYMVIADIYSADKSTPCTLVANPVSSLQIAQAPVIGQPTAESMISLTSGQSLASRNLTGSTVASGNLLTNLENETGVYFVFQDISVRSEESTALSKHFAKQGIKIPIRKEPRFSRKRLTGQAGSSASGDRDLGSDSEDDDDQG
ncbi:hypothetical protein BGX26_002126, partial [Mortierella sp. AD094]